MVIMKIMEKWRCERPQIFELWGSDCDLVYDSLSRDHMFYVGESVTVFKGSTMT